MQVISRNFLCVDFISVYFKQFLKKHTDPANICSGNSVAFKGQVNKTEHLTKHYVPYCSTEQFSDILLPLLKHGGNLTILPDIGIMNGDSHCPAAGHLPYGVYLWDDLRSNILKGKTP